MKNVILPFQKNNVVLICSTGNGIDKLIHERTVQLARLKAVYYLG